MEINYLGIFLCALASMIVGSLWYGPLFGKAWMRVIGATEADAAERKTMQKKAIPLYIIQFFLTLFQAFVLSQYITGWPDTSEVEHSLWILGAFVIPTLAASAMWNNDTTQVKLARFSIQAGYYLVTFILFALILSW